MPDPSRARADALRLLKFRPRSEAELRRRLVRKGTDPSTIDALLNQFKQRGWVDDAKFAQYLVTQKTFSKPVGRRFLLDQLSAKGVDPVLAAQAVEKGTRGQDDLELARELASRRAARMKGLNPEAVRRRLFGLLSRRGFPIDVVYKVVREVAR